MALGMKRKIKTTAFSGIAATLLPKGETNHKLLKLPMPVNHESTSMMDLGSEQAKLLKATDIIIWDEAPSSLRYCLEICDKLLRDLTKVNQPFGGKIMLLGGDFRQTLPIKEGKNVVPEEIIDLTIKRSPLFQKFEIVKLTENMRADPNEKQFAMDILKIGDGSSNDEQSMVTIPTECVTHGSLHEKVFGDCINSKDTNKYERMSRRAILAPKNNVVDTHNIKVLNMLPGNMRSYESIDKAEGWEGNPLPDEIFRKMNVSGFSLSSLKLKEHAIVILIRTLMLYKGLCNGTRMRILKMGERYLHCILISGDRANKDIFLPKITLIDDKHFCCELHRHQFPVKLAFAMSINKAQGQSFENIGIDLTDDVFAHGQLYVALSRAPSWKAITVKLPKGNKDNKTKNVVYQEVLC